MEKALKDKWVEALRSGKYEQGKNYLKRRNEETNDIAFCCLGVLYDISGNIWTNPNEDYCATNKNETTKFLNPEIYGLTNDQQSELILLNDGLYKMELDKIIEYSFTEIADWIEANIEEE